LNRKVNSSWERCTATRERSTILVVVIDPSADRLDISTSAGEMPAHRWLPDRGTGPGILLLQEIFGISQYIQHRARDLAGLGYVVLAPEIYWRLGEGPLDEAAEGTIDQAVAVRMKIDWPAAVEDAASALGVLRALPEVHGGVGAVGFCFGGGLAFNLVAVAQLDAVVAYYGSDVPRLLDLAPQIRAPTLYHHGLADDYIPVETVRQIESAVGSRPGAEFRTYEDANHAFDNDRFFLHHPVASAAAWQATIAFLGKHLPLAS
jgi:carboxymethylenebutenolidase